MVERFLKNGRLITIPKKAKDKRLVFNYIYEILLNENKNSFTEKEINEVIKPVYEDFALVRRYFVDNGYLSRDSYGKQYYLNFKSEKDLK